MNLLKFFTFFSLSTALSLPGNSLSPKIKSIDKKIVSYTSSATMNNFISPLVGIIDGIWIGKLGTSEMLAGSGYGDEVFGISYDLTKFISPIITPEIAELHVSNKKNKINELVYNSLILSTILGMFVGGIVFMNAEKLVELLISKDFEMYKYAVLYLKYRVLSLPFSLINSTIFGILRGVQDFNIALWINTKSQILNMILDPILMNKYGLIGIVIGTVIAEIYCCYEYVKELAKKNMIDLNCKINLKKILEILKNGFSVQVKNLNYNFMMIFINNKIMKMNNPSKNLAAHVIMSKLYQLGSIFHSGLSSVGSIIIPIEKIDNNDKLALSRLNKFGNMIGVVQFTLILGFKFLINLFTSDEIVIKECYKILFPLALLEYFNSLGSVYEGTLQGYKKYNEQALIAFLSFASIFLGLKYCTNLSHVWYSILGMSFIRLITSYLIVKF